MSLYNKASRKHKTPYMIIDEHVHLGHEADIQSGWRRTRMKRFPARIDLDEKAYDEGKKKYPGMKRYFVEAGRWDKKYLDPSAIPPYTIDDLVYAMDDAGIDMAVVRGSDYLEDRIEDGHEIHGDAEYVASVVERYPERFVGCGPINPWEKGVAYRIKYYVEDLHLKGVGEVKTGIHYDDRERMYPIYEKCIEYDIPIFLHPAVRRFLGRELRIPRPNVPWANPRYLEDVVLDFPDLRVVMHPYEGAGSRVIDGIICQLIKKYPKNFTTQVAYQSRGIHTPETKEWILWCQENIPDNVVYATDTPVSWPQKESVEWILYEMPELTEEFKKKIFETNVRRVYKF